MGMYRVRPPNSSTRPKVSSRPINSTSLFNTGEKCRRASAACIASVTVVGRASIAGDKYFEGPISDRGRFRPPKDGGARWGFPGTPHCDPARKRSYGSENCTESRTPVGRQGGTPSSPSRPGPKAPPPDACFSASMAADAEDTPSCENRQGSPWALFHRSAVSECRLRRRRRSSPFKSPSNSILAARGHRAQRCDDGLSPSSVHEAQRGNAVEALQPSVQFGLASVVRLDPEPHGTDEADLRR
jgi:hypothetical protein